MCPAIGQLEVNACTGKTEHHSVEPLVVLEPVKLGEAKPVRIPGSGHGESLHRPRDAEVGLPSRPPHPARRAP
jgi:hypothetical protein